MDWNTETILVWLNNEQSSYEYWNDSARDILADHEPPRAIYLLATELQDAYELQAEDAQLSGPLSDILGQALREVNWGHIARHIIENLDT